MSSVSSRESIQSFESDWAIRRRESDQPAPRRRVLLNEKQLAEALPFMEAAAARRSSVREEIERRLAIGYVWHGGAVGDNFVAAFVESGLRTQVADAHVLRRFVQLTPRARRSAKGLQCGHSKGRLALADAKLLGLDEAYVQLNPVMRGGWRIDIDRDFPSWDALRDDLEQIVRAGGLPCLPHACVAWRSPHSGRVQRPHLWWLLPYKASVWHAPEDPRCSSRIMSFFKGVVAGCTAALLPLGADPNAASLPLKGKNPLSPLWDSVFWNQNLFPSLSDWSECVDTGATAGRLSRQAAMVDSGLDSKRSNAKFLTCQKLAFDSLREMHRADDADYHLALLDRSRLAALLKVRSRKAVAAIADDKQARRQVFAIFSRVADYAAGAWDASRLRGDVDRGACAGDVEGRPLAERQAAGGRYGAAQRADASRRAIVAAAAALEKAGIRPTQGAVADNTGLSLRTVKRHWPSVRAAPYHGVSQCIDPLAPKAPASSALIGDDVAVITLHPKTVISAERRASIHMPYVPDGMSHTSEWMARQTCSHPLVVAVLAQFPSAVCVRISSG